ncbi:hypothetical protein pdam_00020454 [Pocillopora damicornis]|uniref:Isopropylmalate dehydrogenase-like domain-containing protein n=1 Tax=Pocillopora damicornis TaxID=46731 RepID=A0A3M6U4H6_POCDA|nr:hypothetical protein pdam_00020454 [Pocillopora damicornis]
MAAMKLSRFTNRILLTRSFQVLLPAAWCKTRSFSNASEPLTQAQGRYMVTLIPGDGVGPELVYSVKRIFSAAGAPVDWDEIPVSDMSYGSRYTLDDVVQSMKKTGVGLKGALTTPSSISSQDHLSLNQKMKTELDLFANVVHCKSLPGYKTSVPGVVEMIKVITKKKSERIAKFAFDYATKHKRQKVTAVHKANIMKQGDGLFLKTCEEVSKLYPKIKFEGMIVDNTCMQGARHTYAGVAGRNIANPTAMILASVDMLDHMNLGSYAKMIKDGLEKTIAEGQLTMDMGGSASTSDFVQAIIGNMYS